MTPEEKRLKDQADAIEQDRTAAEVQALSIEVRLLRRARMGYIEVPFKDDAGEFSLKMRVPTNDHRQQLMQVYAKLADPKVGDAEIAKLNEQVAGIMAYLVPEIPLARWREGAGIGSDVTTRLVRIAMGTEPVSYEQLSYFRNK